MGFDAHGYGYRDLEGCKVHQGRREPYGASFAKGDVVGMIIHLPAGGRPIELRNRKVVRYKGAQYVEDEPEPKPEVLAGSRISFTLNGVPQGTAFTDIMEGTYYPCASIYTLPEQLDGAEVRANFGPDFEFPPPESEGMQPVSAAAKGAAAASALLEAAGDQTAFAAPAVTGA